MHLDRVGAPQSGVVPPLGVMDAGREQLGERDVERPARPRAGRRRSRARRRAGRRTARSRTATRRCRCRRARRRSRRRRDRDRSPRCASRSAVAREVGVDAGSRLPPGNAISPWCDRHRLGALREDDAGLAVLLEERDEHCRGPPFDGDSRTELRHGSRRRQVGETAAHLGERRDRGARPGAGAGPTRSDRRAAIRSASGSRCRPPRRSLSAAAASRRSTGPRLPSRARTSRPRDGEHERGLELRLDLRVGRRRVARADRARSRAIGSAAGASSTTARHGSRPAFARRRAHRRLEGGVVPLQLQRVHRGPARHLQAAARFRST